MSIQEHVFVIFSFTICQLGKKSQVRVTKSSTLNLTSSITDKGTFQLATSQKENLQQSLQSRWRVIGCTGTGRTCSLPADKGENPCCESSSSSGRCHLLKHEKSHENSQQVEPKRKIRFWKMWSLLHRVLWMDHLKMHLLLDDWNYSLKYWQSL